MDETVIELFQADTSRFSSPAFLLKLHEWGIDVIRFIQQVETPALTAVVKFITALGTEALYVPLLLLVFWAIDEKRGLRLGILIIVSAWINSVLKVLLRQPRPFDLDPALALAVEHTYGAPSGHAQMALCFWVSIAAWLGGVWPKRRTLIWAAAFFIVLIISFTRLYLGVHFPTDLFAGWLLAALILAGFFAASPRLETFLAKGGTRLQNIAAAGIALIMNGLFPHDRTLSALFLGFCLGYILMKQRFPFSARLEINGKKPDIRILIARCFTGFAGFIVLFFALRLIFPGAGSFFSGTPIWGADSPFYEMSRFIRYGLLGFWASAGAPRLFQRMSLAHGEPER